MSHCAVCLAPREAHELTDRGGEQVCRDRFGCEDRQPPLVEITLRPPPPEAA